jgi:hypothetical protein
LLSCVHTHTPAVRGGVGGVCWLGLRQGSQGVASLQALPSCCTALCAAVDVRRAPPTLCGEPAAGMGALCWDPPWTKQRREHQSLVGSCVQAARGTCHVLCWTLCLLAFCRDWCCIQYAARTPCTAHTAPLSTRWTRPRCSTFVFPPLWLQPSRSHSSTRRHRVRLPEVLQPTCCAPRSRRRLAAQPTRRQGGATGVE